VSERMSRRHAWDESVRDAVSPQQGKFVSSENPGGDPGGLTTSLKGRPATLV
jgi:hypothetical protein